MEPFEKELTSLGAKILNLKSEILTEEATKNAFVLPFLQILGYDVFNPLEVIPEFVADISTKKGEKVDYCILKNGEPIVIIECKNWQESLSLHNTQLERYFTFTKARFGILTNGIEYWFYTDLDEPNKMDLRPFFELDMLHIRDSTLTELKNFRKTGFDARQIFDAANQMRYIKEVRQLFEAELKEPSNQWVRFFAGQVYDGRLTTKTIEQFSRIVKKAIQQTINETISERLQKAIDKESKHQEIVEVEVVDPAEVVLFEDDKKGIVTTQEEMNGFEVVRDILKGTVGHERVSHRDTKSYFGILLDDNNRKPICRLHFGGQQKYLGLFDREKQEKRVPIGRVEHIYKFAEEIADVVVGYLEVNKTD